MFVIHLSAGVDSYTLKPTLVHDSNLLCTLQDCISAMRSEAIDILVSLSCFST